MRVVDGSVVSLVSEESGLGSRMTDGRRFQRVGVLVGGISEEREVSLVSGQAIGRGLRDSGYDVVEVEVCTRDVDVLDGLEAVFIALHGKFGEDGEVQALLDDRHVPYTGSGAMASRTAFDKIATKQRLQECEIPTPEYSVGGNSSVLDFPVVVKPACQGSSIGIHLVEEQNMLERAIDDALLYGDEVMVEAYIAGRELTVGIVEEDVMPVVEIVAPCGWYDYHAKYTKGQCTYMVPADVDECVAEECQKWALLSHQALGCRGFSRVDFRMTDCGKLYVLEINTIPGFTETSLLPKAAGAAGVSFPDLCDRIMNSARHG